MAVAVYLKMMSALGGVRSLALKSAMFVCLKMMNVLNVCGLLPLPSLSGVWFCSVDGAIAVAALTMFVCMKMGNAASLQAFGPLLFESIEMRYSL